MIWKIQHEMNTVQKTKYSYKSTVLWFSCCWMYRLVYLYFFEHLGISISINSNCSFIEHIVENNDLTDSFEFWKSLIKLKWHLHFLISKEAERVNRSVAQGLGLRPFVKFSSALWSVRAETPQLNIHTTLAVDVNVEVGWKFCVREASRTLALFWAELVVSASTTWACQYHEGISYQSGATPRVKYCDHRRCYLSWRQGLVTFVTGACCHDRPVTTHHTPSWPEWVRPSLG